MAQYNHPSSVVLRLFRVYLSITLQMLYPMQSEPHPALIFLSGYVLQQPINDRIDAIRAKRSRKLPTVFASNEAIAVIQQMSGVQRLIVQLLHSSGLRLREAMQLRVKNLGFSQCQVIVRDAKGQESQVTMVPTRLNQSSTGETLIASRGWW